MGRGLAATTQAIIATVNASLAVAPYNTVRGLCYILFVAQMIASMATRETKRISDILTRARERGEVDWTLIVEKGRQVRRLATWADPAEYRETVLASYRKDWWQSQPVRVVVFSEKSTVEGVLGPVLDAYQVPFQPLEGWSSFSKMKWYATYGAHSHQPLLLLYVGDFDPSGMYMSEIDVPSRLLRYGAGPDTFRVQRIALLREDGESLGPSVSFPATAKRRDPRYPWFVDQYGDTCWEVDAMDPNVLRERVESAIREAIDLERWEQCQAVEAVERENIRDLLDRWPGISGPVQE